MPRNVNLRQIEALKAVIESGTVSRAAELLNISQPAMSKLVAHLEFDTGLKLFDRVKGRLAPTKNGLRLYEEVDRIFAGLRQVDNAVESIRREDQGRIAIGVIPALSGPFIQRSTTGFLKQRQSVFCSVQARNSQWIVEQIIARKLDIGLVSETITNPYVSLEPVMERSLVCIMPLDHPLVSKSKVEPDDLQDLPFVSYPPDSHTGDRISASLDAFGVKPRTVIVANLAMTICEFVAAGAGVSIVHPLFASELHPHLAVRRFEPDIVDCFQLCRTSDSRNAELIEAFAQQLRATADDISSSMTVAP